MVLRAGHTSPSPRRACERLPSDRRKTAVCFVSSFFFFLSHFFESGSHCVALGSLDFTMYARLTHSALPAFVSAGIN